MTKKTLFKGDVAGDDGVDGLTEQGHAVVRSVAGPGASFGDVVGPALLGIEDGDVGKRVGGEGAAAFEIDDAGGVGGHEFDDASERELALAMKMSDDEGEGDFESGDAEGGLVELDFFFEEGVRGVIGGDGVDGAVVNGAE